MQLCTVNVNINYSILYSMWPVTLKTREHWNDLMSDSLIIGVYSQGPCWAWRAARRGARRRARRPGARGAPRGALACRRRWCARAARGHARLQSRSRGRRHSRATRANGPPRAPGPSPQRCAEDCAHASYAYNSETLVFSYSKSEWSYAQVE